jgi:hypothetical protein
MNTNTQSDVYKPGDIVKSSGIYRVIHDKQHAETHEITAIHGKKFPPCNHCGHHPRFVQVRSAQHIIHNQYFKN